jgi:hypothetical protein
MIALLITKTIHFYQSIKCFFVFLFFLFLFFLVLA